MVRRECIKFNITLDKKKYDEFKKEIDTLYKESPILVEGETVNIHWNFFIEYYNVIDKINAINTLTQNGVIVDFDYEEFEYGESLLIEMLNKLQNIKRINHQE